MGNFPAAGGLNLFDGVTMNWGFTAGDVWSNGMVITASFATFILLGLAITYAPAIIALIRTAVAPK